MNAISLQGVIVRTEERGFMIEAEGQERHRPARHARRQEWFSALSADDRQTVTAWLWIWAQQARRRQRLAP